MLFEMAIGDAYGAGFEYANPDFVSANNRLTSYVKHPKHNLVPGCYTDDTQMSIANTEVICSGVVGRERLAEAYVECFKRDQREGYAGGFYKFLCEIKDGAEFLSRMKPHSDKSGGAMRALPFGVYPETEVVKAMAAMQAAITHNTPNGLNAAVAAALMSHFFLYNLGAKSELGSFVEAHVSGTWAAPWAEPVGEKGWMSVRAAITAIMAGNSMTEILRRCVDFTGDVDTVAALALGAAAASSEVAQDLPDVLIQGLENGTYGRDFLRTLDQRLLQAMVSLRQVSAASVQQLVSNSSANAVVAPHGQRILVVQIPEQWTGAVNDQSFLEIPANMDVARSRPNWSNLSPQRNLIKGRPMTANDQSIQYVQSPLRHAVDLALLSGARAAQIATANGIALYMPTLAVTLKMLSEENNHTASKAEITNLKEVLCHLQKALSRTAVHDVTDLFELHLFVGALQLVLKRARALFKSAKPQQ